MTLPAPPCDNGHGGSENLPLAHAIADLVRDLHQVDAVPLRERAVAVVNVGLQQSSPPVDVELVPPLFR